MERLSKSPGQLGAVMFESIRKERTLVDILRCLLLPVVVALAMDIPMEIDLYTLRLNDSAAMSFIWLYFHAVIAGALSFGGPQHPWGAWPSFLTKDENSWLMTVVNVAFYVLLTVWC